MASSPADAAKKKRTRTNVKQSKYGCFTCKARRIKCDELKPICRRCLTAKRFSSCDYPRGAPPSSSSTSSPESPQSCLTLGQSHPQDSFVNLTCRVLVQGPRRAKSELELAFWSHAVPQLTHSIPSVRAAAAAFGASYHVHVLGGHRTSEAIECYSRALRLVQLELSSLYHGTVPCIVACLFLSCAEALQQRLDKGLLHLQGAFTLMTSRAGSNAKAMIDMEGVSLLFQKFDLHSATYALGRAPDLPPLPSPTPDVLLSKPPDQVLFSVLHSCYHFTSAASRYKYVSNRLVPPELLIEQGRQLANLKQWLSYHAAPADSEHLLVLRVQCLAALIYAANILEPRESAFDCYSPEFEDIISSAETLAQYPNDDTSLGTRPGLPNFTPEMGIIHPLYFAALKYRHPAWRRRAIDLLRKSGREGPWCGDIEAAVVSAIVRVEERLASSSLGIPGRDSANEPGDFAESDRISLCWPVEYMDKEADNDCGNRSQMAGTRSIKVVLVRCHDVDKMLRGSVIGPCQDPWRDQTHWDRWEEIVELL
ncbi:hypothetical protein B0T10DRAFT_521894 [Thelonectria olida]|uniref:Zn(2)-C6 fungal-type domain-containing protein n=1 Tax=Thelonectria olida TaxID=1576542 RepID=A0A9P8VTH2_9HYPO|nr:hypothetical protein B0T10DRAFT_521894 [Thelonectria olida]